MLTGLRNTYRTIEFINKLLNFIKKIYLYKFVRALWDGTFISLGREVSRPKLKNKADQYTVLRQRTISI